MNMEITQEDINKLRNMLEIYKEIVNTSKSFATRRKSIYKPQVSIHQTVDYITVMAKIPGLEKSDDIKIVLNGNILQLNGMMSGSMHNSMAVKTIPFSRVVLLPSYIKQDEVSATYKKDILEIRLIKDKNVLSKEVRVNFL